MDWIDYVAFLSALILGFVGGRKSVSDPPVPPVEKHADGTKPICSCEHYYGQHADPGKKCKAQVKRYTRTSSKPTREHPNVFEWVTCTCQCYDGPSIALF